MQTAKLPAGGGGGALGRLAPHGRLPKTQALLSQGNLDYFADWMEMHFEY